MRGEFSQEQFRTSKVKHENLVLNELIRFYSNENEGEVSGVSHSPSSAERMTLEMLASLSFTVEI